MDGLPIELRRRAARAVVQGRRWAPVRAAAALLAGGIASWLAFNVVLVAWHLPAAYDLTLGSPPAHALEHAMFFAVGLLFWTRVVDSPPWRSPLGAPARPHTSARRWSSAGSWRAAPPARVAA